jgi:transmembrane sensor
MNKGKFDIEDYLTDKDFIHWVKDSDGPQKVFWQAWIASNPDHFEKINRAREILLTMKFKSFELVAEDYEEVLESLLSRRGQCNQPIGYRHWDRTADYGIFWRVAAILMMAFSISFVIYSVNMKVSVGKITQKNTTIYKTTGLKQRSHFNLPDGTLVWLNSCSKLFYDVGYGEVNRKVYLEGEAFFEVAVDSAKPFIVKSGDMLIQALGTSFNVNTVTSSGTDIALLTGSVQVWIENFEDESVVLQPGERAVYKDEILEMTSFNAMEIIGWKDGILHFHNANFSEVKNRLENWYDVQIIAEGIPQSNWNYSGTFIENSLERVLERMSYTKGFLFSIKNEIVQIKL